MSDKEDNNSTLPLPAGKGMPAVRSKLVQRGMEDIEYLRKRSGQPPKISVRHLALKSMLPHYISAVAFSPDGRMALSGSYDRSLNLWDVATGRQLRTFSGLSGYITSLSFSPDGRMVLSGGEDGALILWDIEMFRPLRNIRRISFPFTSVSFSPDGKKALSGSEDNTLILWEVATGQTLRTFEGGVCSATAVSFSPDGKFAMLGGSGKDMFLWDMATGRQLRTFTGDYGSTIASMVFSPDGRMVLSVSNNRDLILWEVVTGRRLQKLNDRADFMNLGLPYRDYRIAISGRWEDILTIWEVWEVTTGLGAIGRLLNGKLVLVVDDQIEIVELLAECLEGLGCSVQKALGGSQAMKWLGIHKPDAMVTGIVMPGMDGLELGRRFRELHPSIPFLIMSGGGATPENIKVAREIGAYRFLVKPFNLCEMTGAIAGALLHLGDASFGTNYKFSEHD